MGAACTACGGTGFGKITSEGHKGTDPCPVCNAKVAAVSEAPAEAAEEKPKTVRRKPGRPRKAR